MAHLNETTIQKIVNHFLGENYIKRKTSYLGYTKLFLYEEITEIFIANNDVLISVYTESFANTECEPLEVVGLLRYRMNEVEPGASVRKKIVKDEQVSVRFSWGE